MTKEPAPADGPEGADGFVEPRRTLLYSAGWWACWWILTVGFRLRRFHMERVPGRGPCLLVANHASHFDPPAVGLLMPRRQPRFVARESLFRIPPFGWLLKRVGATPIRRGGGDIGAIKTILSGVEAGEAVIVFPEGTRSPDGEIREFKRGIALLLKRSKCPVVPVGIIGAYEAFPRHYTLPRPWGAKISVSAGHPIEHADLMRNGPDAALDRLRSEIEALRAELRSMPTHR